VTATSGRIAPADWCRATGLNEAPIITPRTAWEMWLTRGGT
jgi:hypothetical protein